MTKGLLRRTDEEADREALAQRVHGVERTCGWCGIVATSDVDEVLWRTDLNGEQVQFGRCRECCQIADGDLHRTIAARLLNVPDDAVLLDGLTIERFCDRSTARPDRPNPTPWAHVDLKALADAAERNRDDLDARQGGPCWCCGTTLTPPHTAWSRQGREHVPQCGRCAAWLDGTTYSDEGVRVLAAAVLLGQATPTSRPYGPPGFAADVGFVLFCDTGRTKGTPEPFGYLDAQTREAIVERATPLGYGTSLDPARWLLIDRTRMR